MKRFLKLALVFALAVSGANLCACGSGSGQASSSDAEDSVVIGFPSIPEHFDPLQGFGGNHGSGTQLLYSTLVEVDADMNVVCDLANGYSISADALVYTFEIRTDAKFTDGTSVTVDDVLFSYEMFQSAATSVDLSNIDSMSAGENAITITLKQAQSTFILTLADAAIVPKHAYGPDFGIKPVGSGPYLLEQLDVDQQFILQANEDYYREVPDIKRVVFVKLADEDTRLAAIKSGQVDITMSNAVLANVSETPGYNLMITESLDNLGIVMPVVPDTGELNQYGYPVGNNVTCDVNFRKALAYGLDREAICRDALNGYATPAYSENDGMPWSNLACAIDTDTQYAISLLEEAGWQMGDDGIRIKQGMRASFTLLYTSGDSVRQSVAMAASQQAREKLGIEMIVEGASWDQIGTRMYSTPLILAWGSSSPQTSFYLFHSSHAGLDDLYNPENYTSETTDRYLEMALGAISLEAATEYFQLAQWDGSTGTSMRGDCPYVFLINRSHLYWVRDGLNIGRQAIHAHGDSWTLVNNLYEWSWEN
jgi:peptide/nickel transport system substrate-binding protein